MFILKHFVDDRKKVTVFKNGSQYVMDCYTVFDQMQGDSNLRQLAKRKTRLPRENVFIQIYNDTPKIKHL
jgi:hypothetical protein